MHNLCIKKKNIYIWSTLNWLISKIIQNESRSGSCGFLYTYPSAYPLRAVCLLEKDCPFFSNAVAFVEVHQLVERWKYLVPDKVLSLSVLQNLEVLHMLTIAVKWNEWSAVKCTYFLAFWNQIVN